MSGNAILINIIAILIPFCHESINKIGNKNKHQHSFDTERLLFIKNINHENILHFCVFIYRIYSILDLNYLFFAPHSKFSYTEIYFVYRYFIRSNLTNQFIKETAFVWVQLIFFCSASKFMMKWL